jgi:hypothetical protein
MKMRMGMLRVSVVIAILFVVGLAGVVFAVNTPDSLTVGPDSSRVTDNSTKTVSAYGGNTTQLSIDDTKQTARWQGYYGNITGIVTLDDANNFTLIDWSLGTIEGEVYAANATVSDWSTIRCINLSSTYRGHNCTGQEEACLNVTEIRSAYGMSSDGSDPDDVTKTFNETLGSITVGTVTVNNCYMANLYVNDSSQSIYYWNETMLTINDTETIIFTAIVSDDEWGFNNVTWDFQMVVGDNGDDSTATTYNFYVELT